MEINYIDENINENLWIISPNAVKPAWQER